MMAEKRRDERSHLALMFAFNLVTGIVDAVSYLGLGRVVTANMTGNVVIIGCALAGVAGFSICRSLAALGAFLFGAVVAGGLPGDCHARSLDR